MSSKSGGLYKEEFHVFASKIFENGLDGLDPPAKLKYFVFFKLQCHVLGHILGITFCISLSKFVSGEFALTLAFYSEGEGGLRSQKK